MDLRVCRNRSKIDANVAGSVTGLHRVAMTGGTVGRTIIETDGETATGGTGEETTEGETGTGTGAEGRGRRTDGEEGTDAIAPEEDPEEAEDPEEDPEAAGETAEEVADT